MADNVEVTTQVTSESASADVAAIDVGGGLLVPKVFSSGPTLAGDPAQATTQSTDSNQILAANPRRAALVITNESAVKLYVRFGGEASSLLYTYALAPGERISVWTGVYTGAIEARLESGGDSTAMVQEFTWAVAA